MMASQNAGAETVLASWGREIVSKSVVVQMRWVITWQVLISGLVGLQWTLLLGVLSLVPFLTMDLQNVGAMVLAIQQMRWETICLKSPWAKQFSRLR